MSNIKDSYVYVESKSQDQTCIGIKGGKFAGVIYKYGKVSLGEETEDGNRSLSFKESRACLLHVSDYEFRVLQELFQILSVH